MKAKFLRWSFLDRFLMKFYRGKLFMKNETKIWLDFNVPNQLNAHS